MSKESTKIKVEFALKMIDNIERIIAKHGTIFTVLQDELEARPAVLMALMQTGEALKKIDIEILEKYDLLTESKGVYSVRNFIAHDYEGVDLGLMESTLRYNLPILKEKLEKLQAGLDG